MKPDDFERQLQRQPLRAVPSEWRDEIMAAARRACERSLPTLGAQPVSLWREFILPCRWHWAGLGAAWLIIALLNIVPAPASAPTSVKQNIPSTRQLLMALRENRRQLSELIESPATEPSSVLHPLLPPRRSELQPSTAMA